MKMARRGMTIVETLIAFGFLAVVGIAMISISISAVSITTSARLQTVASRYAESGIESVRLYRDENGWDGLNSQAIASTCYLSAALSTACSGSWNENDFNSTDSSYLISGEINYKRRVELTTDGIDKATVIVKIMYLDRGKTEINKIDSWFTKWE